MSSAGILEMYQYQCATLMIAVYNLGAMLVVSVGSKVSPTMHSFLDLNRISKREALSDHFEGYYRPNKLYVRSREEPPDGITLRRTVDMIHDR